MSQIRPGLVIAGRYRLDVLAGEGGMATVWRGTDQSLSRDVAIKVLREEVAAHADAVSRFRREAHAAAKLNHPNIVQIYDTGVDGDIHFIVMEYLSEPDLKKVIKGWAPLPEDRAIDVATQCCRALAYAHRNGIVHRDVKPHNILFTDDGRAELSDFGIAAAVGTGGADAGDFVLGSAHYISPEQAQGSPAGPHSDVYSLGCVLYECLSGKTPFSGASEAEIAANHVRERPVPIRSLNPRVSPAAEFVVNKAMAREIAQRYRTAEEMLGDLVKLSGGEDLERTGVLAAPEGATTVLQREYDIKPPADPGTANIRDRFAAQEPPDDEPPTVTRTAAPVIRPPAEPQRPLAAPIIAIVLMVIALGLILWLSKTLFYPGQAARNVQVPMIQGRTLGEAKSLLETNDLLEGTVTYDEDPMQPAGNVIEQNPAAGEMVTAGSRVDLVVNRGTEEVVTVSVEGRTLEDANQVLERAGLSLGDITEIYHATVPEGVVIKQSPKPGTPAERSYPVDVIVSKGKEPETAVTPPTPTPSEDTPVSVVEPEVQMVEDENHTGGDGAERKFIVTVSVQGQELGQHIQVVKQDDRGGRVVVLSKKLDPNQTYDVPVITEGAAIIEVIHNSRVVFRQEEPAPSTTPEEAVQPPTEPPTGD